MNDAEFPAPPVPPDADLKDFPFTPLYRARLFGSSFHARATDAEWRAGVTLWLKSKDQVPAGSLPDDDVDLCRLAELGRVRTWRKIRPVALRGWFKCSDGRLYHRVVAEIVLAAWSAKLKRQAKEIRRLGLLSGEWDALRSIVYARDDFTCVYCGARGVQLECDHIVPLARGGSTSVENLATACRQCNRSKGSKLNSEWRQ